MKYWLINQICWIIYKFMNTPCSQWLNHNNLFVLYVLTSPFFQIFKGRKKKLKDLSKMLPRRVRGMCVWSSQRRWSSQNVLSQNFTPPKPTWTLWCSVWRISLVSFTIQQLCFIYFFLSLSPRCQIYVHVCQWRKCIFWISSSTACRWGPAEEHRGHESNAESRQSPRDPGHNEGAVKGDDEGRQQHPTYIDHVYSQVTTRRLTLQRTRITNKTFCLTTEEVAKPSYRVLVFIFQAGIIEEMLEDTFESMEDGEEMEEEAEEEVDKILFEITAGTNICLNSSSLFPCSTMKFWYLSSEPQVKLHCRLITLKAVSYLCLLC